MQLILIAAMAQNRVIGYQNTIPWQIKGEQKLFKKHTFGHTVVMGRKTFESIGKPLAGRKNIIISTQKEKILNRLLSKLAAESKIQGDSERRTGMYGLVHEDSSTESTQQFASAVEFPKKSNADGAIIVSSIQDALEICKNDEKVFIIGGSNIYQQTINIADYVYLTILNRQVEGDSFFPELNENFILISSTKIQLSEEVNFVIYRNQNK